MSSAQPSRRQITAKLSHVCTTMVWGSSLATSKAILPAVPPMSFVTVRFGSDNIVGIGDFVQQS
jgi:hypothetical protein